MRFRNGAIGRIGVGETRLGIQPCHAAPAFLSPGFSTVSPFNEREKRDDPRRWQEFIEKIGGPDTIRTYDLCLRRATLYPAELRVPYHAFSLTMP